MGEAKLKAAARRAYLDRFRGRTVIMGLSEIPPAVVVDKRLPANAIVLCQDPFAYKEWVEGKARELTDPRLVAFVTTREMQFPYLGPTFEGYLEFCEKIRVAEVEDAAENKGHGPAGVRGGPEGSAEGGGDGGVAGEISPVAGRRDS